MEKAKPRNELNSQLEPDVPGRTAAQGLVECLSKFMKTSALNQTESRRFQPTNNMSNLLKRTLALAGALAVMSGTLAQADQTKSSTPDNLNVTTSWVSGTLPGPSDIAIWTTGSFTTNSLGANAAWLGIKVITPSFPVTIANDGNWLTNGRAGINMSSASQSLTLSNNLVLGTGPQNWTVANSSYPVSSYPTNVTRVQGAGLRFYVPNNDISESGGPYFVLGTGSGAATNRWGSVNEMIGATTNSSFGEIYFATINDIDLAAINSIGQVVGGSQISGLYTVNTVGGSTPTDNTVHNVANFTTGTPGVGWRFSGATTWGAAYLNTPQTFTGAGAIYWNGNPAWEITHSSGRNLTCYTVLMTTNLGQSALFDNVGATTIIGTRATRDILVYQNNPAAPYVMQTVLTETGTNTPAFLNKFGAGTMELENQNGYAGGTEIYEGTLKVDAIGDQSLLTSIPGGVPVAQLTPGSLGVSVRIPVSAFLGWTNSVNVFGGNLTQAAPNTNSIPIFVYKGATNIISLTRANLELIDGSSTLPETIFDSSTNFSLTFTNGSHVKFAYANGVAPSATVAPLFVTNAWSYGSTGSPGSNCLTANGTVTVDVECGSLSVGTFPLITYSGIVGGDGGSAFVLGNVEPHCSASIVNDTANHSIDLVVSTVTQPLHWDNSRGAANWDINDAANNVWTDSGTPTNYTYYQELGDPMGDNVSFDDVYSTGTPTVALNAQPIPSSVKFTGAVPYTLSGNGGISGVGSVTISGPSTTTIATSNSFTGGLNINGGILKFTTLTNLGASAINFGGGTLQYNANNDDISVQPVAFNNPGSSANVIDLSAATGNTVTFTKAIGVTNGFPTGGFTLKGGTLNINQTNRYTGNTIINSGATLLLQSSSTYITNSSAIINNGFLNALSQLASGMTLSTPASQILCGTGTNQGDIYAGVGTTISPATNGLVGTLDINGDLFVTGGTLAMDITGPTTANTKDLITIDSTGGNGSGNLTLGAGLNAGTLQLSIVNTPLSTGNYKLITYTGGLNGAAGTLKLTGSSVGAGVLGYLKANPSATPPEIDLVVITGKTNQAVWVGNVSGSYVWDVDNIQNWKTNGVAPAVFDNGDTNVFDDTGSAASPVLLGDPSVAGSGTLLPGNVTLNVSANNYTFADGVGDGSGALVGGTALTINGPTLPTKNTTTLLVSDGNSGPTTINGSGSTLVLGNGSTDGDIGTGIITNNGTLVFDQAISHVYSAPIYGSGSVVQEGATVLAFAANCAYTGLTIISNSTSELQVGLGSAAGTYGTGAVIDNGLLLYNHTGTVALNNISGSGSVAVVGASTVTLSGNTATYLGNTFLTNGAVKLAVVNQIPNGVRVAGSTGILGLGATLDLNTNNQTVNGLTDLGVAAGLALITNSAGTNGPFANYTNILTIGLPSMTQNTTNTFNGNIMDKTNAVIAVVINSPGIQTLTGQASNFKGGVILGLGELQLGQGGPNIAGNVAAGAGGILMSNGTTLMLGGNNTTFVANNVTIAPASSVTIAEATAGAYSDQFSGLISGDALSTNIIGNQTTISGAGNWNAFPGRVIIPAVATTGLRGNGNIGGTNTTFEIDGVGAFFARNSADVDTLGALTGDGTIVAPSNPGATLIIGTKGVNSTFAGDITGNYNITKAGTATLTFDGGTNFTAYDGVTYIYTNGLTYVGATTISNGTLAIVAPANLQGTNFASFTLTASSAVLDISSMGSSPDYVNLVTNSTLSLSSPQTLSGIGTILGSVTADAGPVVVSVGFQPNTNGLPVTGVLNVTNVLTLENSAVVNINLSRTNTPNSGELAANSFSLDNTPTLVVTNVGSALYNGDTFTLFSQPIATNKFVSITLPATDPTAGTNYVWTDNIGNNGTITLLSGGLIPFNTNRPPVQFTVSGGNLTLFWPTNLGWYLQAQTNLLSIGISNNWVDVTGSSSVTNEVIPINTTNPTVFYRLSSQP